MTDRQQQWFHFGPWVFDIDAAQALIAAAPRDTLALNVAAWATAYGLTCIDDPHRRGSTSSVPPRTALTVSTR